MIDTFSTEKVGVFTQKTVLIEKFRGYLWLDLGFRLAKYPKGAKYFQKTSTLTQRLRFG